MRPKTCAKALVRRMIRPFGYDIHKVNLQGSSYGTVLPVASYSPWNADEEFMTLYKVVRHNTLVDIYRCYELWSLVAQTAKLDGGLIEVGVWRGGTGALIAKRAISLGVQDSVYLCDTFQGVVKASDKDSKYQGGEHADTSRRDVESLVSALGLSNVVILEGVFPEETTQSIAHEAFRFCHIDVDVYLSARDIHDWIWKKMVIGGIIVYDDYGFKGCNGVTRFVEEQRDCPDRLIIHNLNGHAIVIKIA
jgi:O-methyltransferase